MTSSSVSTRQRMAGTGLVALDPWLEPHAGQLQQRFSHYQRMRAAYESDGGLAGAISRGHDHFGFTRGTHDNQTGVWYREWALGAQQLALVGDFNDWRPDAHPMQRDERGVWQLFLPDERYADKLTHGSRVKVRVTGADGRTRDRIPAYIRRVVQDQPDSPHFTALYWNPPEPYPWQHEAPIALDGGLRIYEAHVGMAQEEEKVGTFEAFAEHILPRIAALGYNAIQLMAIQEHPYYGSFGYHVSSFYAVSSRFGAPEQLKALIDAAHALGLRVVMDHSRSVSLLMREMSWPVGFLL